jgi:hypothetical protein
MKLSTLCTLRGHWLGGRAIAEGEQRSRLRTLGCYCFSDFLEIEAHENTV